HPSKVPAEGGEESQSSGYSTMPVPQAGGSTRPLSNDLQASACGGCGQGLCPDMPGSQTSPGSRVPLPHTRREVQPVGSALFQFQKGSMRQAPEQPSPL